METSENEPNVHLIGSCTWSTQGFFEFETFAPWSYHCASWKPGYCLNNMVNIRLGSRIFHDISQLDFMMRGDLMVQLEQIYVRGSKVR